MTTMREQVRELVAVALHAAMAEGRLPALESADVAAFEISRPANPDHGDYATNAALKLAGPMRRPPRDIAQALLESIPTGEVIERVEVAGPGFVNLFLAPGHVEGRVDAIRDDRAGYGRSDISQPQRINVEFVSANPTGPLHVGNARGAFVGDLVSRVLEAVGHQVTREYYFNDSGTQVELLGRSVRATAAGQPVPEDGYHGDYVGRLAQELPADLGLDDALVGNWAQERVRQGIEASLERLGVHFDTWTSERVLVDDGWVAQGVDRLTAAGHTYEQEGALWFRSTAFGDDKDRVIFRSNGEPTYFAKDIGYLVEKSSRDFDELLYLWGADHHGTVARLRNAAEALGIGRAHVNVLLIAWVRFVRDGREVSMSKRAGEFVTLDELLAEVGVDAARWFFASRAPSTGIDFDIELAKAQSHENPVYYVQYAHARISSILRKAAEAGLAPAPALAGSLAGDEVALGLAKTLLQLPDVVLDAAAARETQPITTYATDLATIFHAFYRDRRVIDGADPATSSARLALVDATRLTLANALGLLGISAPETM